MESSKVYAAKRTPRLEIGHQRMARNASPTLETLQLSFSSIDHPQQQQQQQQKSINTYSCNNISVTLTNSQPSVPTTLSSPLSFSSSSSSSETVLLSTPSWTSANHYEPSPRHYFPQQQQQQQQQPPLPFNQSQQHPLSPRRASKSTPSSPCIKALAGTPSQKPQDPQVHSQKLQPQPHPAVVLPAGWNIDPPPPGPPPVPPSPHSLEPSGVPIPTVPCESFSVLHALFKSDMDKKVAHAAVNEDKEAVSCGAPRASSERACCSAVEMYVQRMRSEFNIASFERDVPISVKWRILAGVISTDWEKWQTEITKQRSDYAVAKASLLPAQAAATSVDRATQQLRTEIGEDVRRTCQGVPLFKKPETADAMSRILFVYAKLYPHVGYIQGMNEILAVVLYVIWKDAQNSEAHDIFGRDFVEPDAFALFSKVMYAVQLLFTSEDIILTRCQAVQLMLAEKDPELERALTELGIQPELYMIRWIRIFFTQLFSLDDTVTIWNYLLLFGFNSGIVEQICVTLLIMIRTSIIGCECSDALSILFNYPSEKVPVDLVINIAINSHVSGQESPLFWTSALPSPRLIMPEFFVKNTTSTPITSPNQTFKAAVSPPPSSTNTISSSSSGGGGSGVVSTEKEPGDFSLKTLHRSFAKRSPHKKNSENYINEEIGMLSKRIVDLEQNNIHQSTRIDRVLVLLQSIKELEGNPQANEIIAELEDIKASLVTTGK